MSDQTSHQALQPSNGDLSGDRRFPSPYEIDPVVAAYMPGVDRTLLRENLKLTHEQRLIKGQSASKMAVELRRAGRAARIRATGS
jgi:hypothetical protein